MVPANPQRKSEHASLPPRISAIPAVFQLLALSFALSDLFDSSCWSMIV